MSYKPMTGMQLAKAQQGVVLLESLIAVLIFSFGIIALISLQALMVKNASGTQYRSEAIFIAQQRMGILWADPINLVNYTEANTDISTLLPGGKRTVVVNPPVVVGDPPTEVSITITWQVPGEPVHSYTTNARVTGI